MYTREQIEQHIWDYIDGSCTAGEKLMVEKLLRSDPEWKSIYLELKDFNTLVATADIMEEPSMRFSRNVMEEVAKYKIAPPAQSYVNKKIIYGIGAFFVLTILAGLVYGFSMIDFSTGSGKDIIPDVDLSRFQFNWRTVLSSPVMYTFLFLDVIAGLLLLDRYLGRKNQKLRESL